MHNNSLITYKDIIETLPLSRRAVMRVIMRKKKVTRHEIAEELGWQINSVTPRVKELLDSNLIYEFDSIRVGKRPRARLAIIDTMAYEMVPS